MARRKEPVYVAPDRFGRVKVCHPDVGEGLVAPATVSYYEAHGWEVVPDVVEPEPEPEPQPKKPARPAKPKE